jgi:hypothetical protein
MVMANKGSKKRCSLPNSGDSASHRHGFGQVSAGFYTPSLLSVFLVVIFVAMLFGTRVLNRPERDATAGQVQYSERYYELVGRESLNQAERAELELEACRYRRDTIRFLANKPLTNLDSEMSRYRQACEEILPLELKLD